MSKQKLSPKQEQILEYIKSQILEKGYPPAVREICAAVSLKSTSSVHSHLESLESKGYIRRDPTKPRAIEIIDDDFQLTRREVVNIPIVGTVTAGEPIIATENVEDYFPMLPEFIGSKNTFIVILSGRSFLDDHHVTVKRFFKEDGHYRLQPENDFMDPIIVDEVSILGKVIGLYRSMS